MRRARRCSTSTIPETRALAEAIPADKVIGYGFDSPGADFMGKDLQLAAGRRHASRSRRRASATTSGLRVPGRHNASNALAAIAAARALGVRIEDAVNALARFEGLQAPARNGRRSRAA